MQMLLRDLLVYTQSGRPHDMKLEKIETGEVLRPALQNLQAAIEESGAVVTQSALPAVLADQDQLSQVFQNLIANAVKYGRPDEPPRVHISAQAHSEGWLFVVQDNGIGVAPEDRHRIFEPFKRLHGHSIPGTGMDLAICRRIVELHGGRTWMASEPGRGSRFFFTLPRQ